MRWRGRRQSSNVEDRRSSQSGMPRRRGGFRLPRAATMGRMGRRIGGGGIGLVVVVVVLALLGVDPSVLLQGTETAPQFDSPRRSSRTLPAETDDDDLRKFVSVVLADTDEVWHKLFRSHQSQYREPRLVLFSGRVRSACGSASAASGPFYCPGDRKLYIDLAFYEQLKRDFDAPGDFAQAYVIAHEVGHHVQNLTGVLPKFNELRRTMTPKEANAMSVRVELQADCFAGIWAHHTGNKGLMERGDLDEALNAARQIGDDTIQRRTQGTVVPESFNHGTARQRRRWFLRGYNEGRISACDSFNSSRL
jgi:predicted metalloprotease